ncbi:MAG: tail fiber domain-containing protein [Candidatus Gastranaerophilales bacterium]
MMKNNNKFRKKQNWICNDIVKPHSAFSLAELMVVLLILSIVMAAFVPVMTTRNASNADYSSPWLYVSDNSNHIYYGVSDYQIAMIGMNEQESTDDDARLIIKAIDYTTDGVQDQSHIIFKRENGLSDAILSLGENANLALGTGDIKAVGEYSIALGHDADASNNYAIALGYEANASGLNAIALGGVTCGTDNGICMGASSSIVDVDGSTITLGNASSSIDVDGNSITIGDASSAVDIADHAIDIDRGSGRINIDIDEINLGSSNIDSKIDIGGNAIVVDNSSSSLAVTVGDSSRTVDIAGSTVEIAGTDITIGDIGSTIDIKGAFYATTSDIRLKNVGEKLSAGLDEINKIQPYNYTYKEDKNSRPRVGVMAQDLQKVFPDAVTEADDGFLRIRQEDMFYALINAVKELDKKISELIVKVNDLIDDFKTLQEQNKKILEQNENIIKHNKDLEKRLKKLEGNS